MEKSHIWELRQMLIPEDRYLLIPFRKVGIYPEDKDSAIEKYGKNNLVLADSELNKGLCIFEDLRLSWNEQQWDAFIKSVYPVWLYTLEEI